MSSSQLAKCIHLHALRWIWNLHQRLTALLHLFLNPYSWQAKLTAVESLCPFRLFSLNDSVLPDDLVDKRKRGEKAVSKEPCFINVNTVTRQNDQPPSSIHNYYSTWWKRHMKSKVRGRKVQTGAVRWTALGKSGSIKFVIRNTPPEVTAEEDTHPANPPPSLSVALWPSPVLSCTVPSFLNLKASIHKAD